MHSTVYETAGSAPSASNPQRAAEPRFPDVVWLKGRGYVPRSALDWYKAQLQALALGVAPVKPPRIEPDPLVPLKAVSAELGVGRRTIGRRIAERQVAGIDQASTVAFPVTMATESCAKLRRPRK
jgi:hypothetical protein